MARAAIRIERKREGAHEAARTLRRVLREKRLLDVTPAEAAAASGLPIALCSEALFHLAKAFPARLRVDEAGTIRFTFASLRPRAAETPFARRLRRLRGWYRRQEVKLLAVGTAMLAPLALFAIAGNALAVYDAAQQGVAIGSAFVVMACLLSGLAIGLGLVMAAYNSLVIVAEALVLGLVLGHPKAWLVVAGVILFYKGLFLAGAWVGTLANPARAEERAARALDPVAFAGAIRAAVQGFLFGPPRAPDDALADERRLTAFLVHHRGVATPGDLMGLFGWDAETASAHLPRLMVDYGGELVVTEHGGLVCRFDPMGKAPTEVAPEPTALGRELAALGVEPAALGLDPAKVWKAPAEPVLEADTRPSYERDASPRLWGCPWWAAAGAFAAMGVGLAGLAADPELTWFPGPGTWAALARDEGMRVFMQGFGVYPYLAVLAPTLARLASWMRRWWAHRAERGFRTLLRVAAEEPAGRLMTGVDLRALVRLGGEVDVERSEGERLWVHFPLLASAAAEAAMLRAAAPAPQAAIVYDTHAASET